jgi:hyaluronan synthase
MRVLPEWLEQRFCGRPAGIGEDRAMTNLILREGFHCHFQRDAMVHTKVPTRYAGLCRMFLRWARSNVRETLVMSGFLFRKFRDGGALGARINLLLQWLGMTVGQVFKFAVLAYLLLMGSAMGARMLLGAAIVATAPAALYLVRHRNSNALWAYAYGLFWVVGLSWIGLYALLTCHKNAWLTRQLPAAPAAPLAAASPGQPSASATPGT